MTSIYSLTIPGNPAIEISQDELRSLLGEIEGELHSSKVYRCALATLQKLLGDSADHAKILFKAVGREAIALAFRQFAQKQPVVETKELSVTQTDSTHVAPTPQPDANLSECLTTTKFQQISPEANTNIETVEPQAFINTENTQEEKVTITPTSWFKTTKKPSKAELAKQAAIEQRIEALRQIGQQLREARELQGLSLSQLNVYTHVPIHQMEAVENGNWDTLPEEVYVRGFIRVMGNALSLNGTTLAASLPAPEPMKSIVPTWYATKSHRGMGLDIRPVHLYVGYTALVAGAVGGLSLMSQQANADRPFNLDAVKPSSSPVSESLKHKEDSKPMKSSSMDIAPPEVF